MNPALSVIFFTVVSGAGYGLLFILGAIMLCAPHVIARAEALLALATGALFAAAGLTSSMLHLGQPWRAWRALSQWRSSWLSREGVCAVLSFAPLLALGMALWTDATDATVRVLAALLAMLATATVLCTAKIYTTLKTIPAWHNAHVLPGYFVFALLGGAAWLLALHAPFAPRWSTFSALVLMIERATDHMMLQWLLAILVVLLAMSGSVLKFFYWRFIDNAPTVATPESATGLGRFGAVRSVETPHTEGNYLTHEMGFRIARKHTENLRRIALVLFGATPMLFALLLFFAPIALRPWLANLVATLLALCVTAGIFVERWLFFAQAKHVVMLYYGAEHA